MLPLTHYTAQYLINPMHPVTVSLVGCGGTGSHMLSNLLKLHLALKAKNHPGIHINAFDNDKISTANIGRQLFAPSEVGINKAVSLITKINRQFGLDWKAYPFKYESKVVVKRKLFSNLLITCVDNAKSRIEISKIDFCANGKSHEEIPFYWLDCGNGKDFGQVILGTLNNIKQPESILYSTVNKLSTITEKYNDLESHDNESEQGPSCSLAQALDKQDLFINPFIANIGADLLWKLFKDFRIDYQGVFLNLKNWSINPVKLQLSN